MERYKELVIFGCGGHSRSVVDIILANDPLASLVFVDQNARENETIYGFPVIKGIDVSERQVFIAIGDNASRKEKFYELGEVNSISVISAKAHIGYKANINTGCFLGNFCHIGPEAMIGTNTIINNAAIVEHEVKIGSHCHIGPNATVSGRCKIGDLVFLGVGATVKDFINICSDVIIGAGATVVTDIIEPGTYVGCPARKIK